MVRTIIKKRTKNYWPISDEHLNYLTTLSVNYNFKWMYYTISKNLKLHSFQKLEVVEHRKISINGEFQCAVTCVGGHISDFVTFILFKNVHKVVCWSLTVINGVIDAFWLAGFECACREIMHMHSKHDRLVMSHKFKSQRYLKKGWCSLF